MKIGIITDSIRKQSTGIGFYAKDLTRELLKLYKENNYIFIDFLETNFNKQNLLKITNPFKFLKTYLWHNYLPFKIKQENLDLVLNFSSVPHLFPYRQKEIFFVYDISWYLFPKYHRVGRVMYHKLLFKISLAHAYKIVVDSISTRQDMIKFFSVPENKIHVIYPSLPESTPGKNTIKEEIDFSYILFIGTIEPRKNIESIIKAYKHLKEQKNIKQKLILCGKKGWMYDAIFDLIKSLNLKDEVIYFGYITDEEKKYLFENAEFFVYPSYYEGFGIPVLEAMSYGCPVITSNVSSLPEVAGTACILVDPNNVNELTEAMKELINNKTLQMKLKDEGLKQVKKLSNKKQIELLLTHIKQKLFVIPSGAQIQ